MPNDKNKPEVVEGSEAPADESVGAEASPRDESEPTDLCPLEGESSSMPVGEAEPVTELAEEVSREATSASVLSFEETKAHIEALLYAAGEPLTFRELKKVLSDSPPETIKQGLEDLMEIYGAQGRGLQIVEVAGGYQITTRPEYHDRISRLFKVKPPARLSVQALETLAAIAYRQPITVPEIMELRGVQSAGVVRTLLEKKLVRIMGRKPVVGRPILYGTSKEFLLRFGLKDLNELPRLEDMAEIFGEEVALPIEDAVESSSPGAAVASPGVPDGVPDGVPNGDSDIASEEDETTESGPDDPVLATRKEDEEIPKG